MSTKLTKLEILSRYKSNMLKFLDSLIEIFPEDPDLIVIRILLETQIPIEESLKKFSARILPNAEMVRKRNEKFFLNDTDMFSGINNDKVVKWKNMWTSGRLDSDSKETIFKWFDLFLSLAETYTNNKFN